MNELFSPIGTIVPILDLRRGRQGENCTEKSLKPGCCAGLNTTQ